MLEHVQKIHCIGIGGIGVSALAELWRAQGKIVSGSDAETGGHRRENVGEVDLVVYSDAVPEDNIERAEAGRRGIPEMSYAQALGQVSRQYRTIVVTGTHGKSTTTAMLGLILTAAGFDPLVLVGSRVLEWGNRNLRLPHAPPPQSSPTRGEEAKGNSPPLVGGVRGGGMPWFVVEGDDYRDHFLELTPYAVVVTSIEWDHPDYFRDLEHTVESFKTLAGKVPENGFVILNEDNEGCKRFKDSLSHSPFRPKRRMITYGKTSEVFLKLQLQVPGQFNRYNATAAVAAAMQLGVSLDVVQKALSGFKGIWRRFEVVGTLPPPLTPPRAGGEKSVSSPFEGEVRRGLITVVSDYAHHPTAIRETMKAAREAYPDRRLVLVYQPHQHSRTKYLFDDFVEVLKDAADVVIVSEIYAVKGRMEDRGVSSRDIVEAIHGNQVIYGGDLTTTKQIVLEQIKPGDVVIFMGAGDIDRLARDLANTP